MKGVTVAVAGPPHSGKSALVESFARYGDSEQFDGTTRVYQRLRDIEVVVKFTEICHSRPVVLPGDYESRVDQLYLDETLLQFDVLMLVVDLSRPDLNNLRTVLVDFCPYVPRERRLLVGTKHDSVRTNSSSVQQCQEFASKYGLTFVQSSALRSTRILLDQCVGQAESFTDFKLRTAQSVSQRVGFALQLADEENVIRPQLVKTNSGFSLKVGDVWVDFGQSKGPVVHVITSLQKWRRLLIKPKLVIDAAPVPLKLEAEGVVRYEGDVYETVWALARSLGPPDYL